MTEKKKSLAINSIYSLLHKIMNIIFPLIASGYAARVLLPSGIGKVAYSQNLVQYFIILASLGIPNYGIREIARNRDSEDEKNRVFSELLIINALSTTACIICYYILVCYRLFSSDWGLGMVVGIPLIFNYLNVEWFYQGEEEYKYIAVRNTIVKFLSMILIVCVVKEKSDYVKFALILSLATTGNFIFNIINLRKKVSFTHTNLRIKPHIKPVLILLATSVSIELYTLLDTTMLGLLCNDDVVGYYSNSTKIARVANSTIASIAFVLLPRLSYYHAQGDVKNLRQTANGLLKILTSLTVPAMVGVFLLADSIIPMMFGVSFGPAIITLRILSVIVFAVALNNFFGTQILLTFGKEKFLLVAVVIGASVNVTLNRFLIPLFFQNGAATASVISEVVVLIITFYFARESILFDINIRFFASLLFSVLFMCGSICLCKIAIDDKLIELLISVLVGSITYFISGTLLKNEGVLRIVYVIKCILGIIENES